MHYDKNAALTKATNQEATVVRPLLIIETVVDPG
jgi:hypothetical protein